MSVEQLVNAVSNHFASRLETVNRTTLGLVVQGLVPDVETVGFTNEGKVALLRDNVQGNENIMCGCEFVCVLCK